MAAYTHSKDLFTEDGAPMVFSMVPCAERIAVRKIIEHGGGKLVPLHCADAAVIRLVPRYTEYVEQPESTLYADYVRQCAQKNTLLPQEEFRFKAQASLQDLDTERQPSPSNRANLRSVRARKDFSLGEEISIAKYVESKIGSRHIRGNKLYKELVKDKIVPHHTWQSVKEHYLKKILPHKDTFLSPLPSWRTVRPAYERRPYFPTALGSLQPSDDAQEASASQNDECSANAGVSPTECGTQGFEIEGCLTENRSESYDCENHRTEPFATPCRSPTYRLDERPSGTQDDRHTQPFETPRRASRFRPDESRLGTRRQVSRLADSRISELETCSPCYVPRSDSSSCSETFDTLLTPKATKRPRLERLAAWEEVKSAPSKESTASAKQASKDGGNTTGAASEETRPVSPCSAATVSLPDSPESTEAADDLDECPLPFVNLDGGFTLDDSTSTCSMSTISLPPITNEDDTNQTLTIAQSLDDDGARRLRSTIEFLEEQCSNGVLRKLHHLGPCEEECKCRNSTYYKTAVALLVSARAASAYYGLMDSEGLLERSVALVLELALRASSDTAKKRDL